MLPCEAAKKNGDGISLLATKGARLVGFVVSNRLDRFGCYHCFHTRLHIFGYCKQNRTRLTCQSSAEPNFFKRSPLPKLELRDLGSFLNYKSSAIKNFRTIPLP